MFAGLGQTRARLRRGLGLRCFWKDERGYAVKWIVGLVAVIGLLVVGFGLWVRLAPVELERWHQGAEAQGMGHIPFAGGHLWRGAMDGAAPEVLARVDEVILATPRTRVIAGSVGEGIVTYQTRSALWGFPDYTTIRMVEDEAGTEGVEIHSRLRFGGSDMGVNRARMEDWLEALGQGG